MMDSLKMALKNAAHDTTRCIILNAMVEGESDNAIWPGYNEQLKNISEYNLKIHSSPGYLHDFFLRNKAGVLNSLGYLAEQEEDVPLALKYYSQSLKIFEETGDKDGIAVSLYNLAHSYFALGNIRAALEFHSKCLKLKEEARDKSGIALSLIQIGNIYHGQGETDLALKYFEKSLKISQELGDKGDIRMVLSNIGGIYFTLGNKDKALTYFERTLALAKETGNEDDIANSLNNIGGVYNALGNLPKALECLKNCFVIAAKLGNKRLKCVALNNIGGAYSRNKQPDVALEYCLKALPIAKELGSPIHLEKIAQNLNLIYKQLALKSGGAKAENNFKKALQFKELFISLHDSMNNEQTKKATIKNQLQYEYDKKEIEVKAQSKAEKEKIELKASEDSKRQNLIIYSVLAGLILVIILSLFIFKSLRQNKEKNKIITVQKNLVDEKQKEILDSIHYAKRIQTALLPHEKYIERNLNKLIKT